MAKGVRDLAVYGLAGFVIAVFGLGALVVGLLIALAPLVSAWGATAIVAGGLFLAAVICVFVVKAKWARMMKLISDKDPV